MSSIVPVSDLAGPAAGDGHLSPEVEARYAGLKQVLAELGSVVKELGYQYVTPDLVGYRTGSLNEVLGRQRA